MPVVLCTPLALLSSIVNIKYEDAFRNDRNDSIDQLSGRADQGDLGSKSETWSCQNMKGLHIIPVGRPYIIGRLSNSRLVNATTRPR